LGSSFVRTQNTKKSEDSIGGFSPITPSLGTPVARRLQGHRPRPSGTDRRLLPSHRRPPKEDCALLRLVRFSSVGCRPTSIGDRAFSAAGPRVWNYLPTDLRQPELSYSRFRQSPKTFLFGQWD